MTSPISAPRVTIARPARSNGVLSIPASATQKRSGPDSEGLMSKPATTRLKLIVRRLPPGLTQAEFEEALGDDWKVNGGKLLSPAKPSRPSRAYLHLTKQDHLNLLSEHVRNTNFIDAKASSKDPALLGPPSVEFAPYGRVPSSRPRKDARQGTIDQDPEFMDFLQSLTNPPAKAVHTDQENGGVGKVKDKVTTTPLIQFLKDKKANKGKENATAPKGAKHSRQDSKDSKSAAVADSKNATGNVTASSPKKRSAQAVKVEQAARDAVKVLNKQAATAKQGNVSPSPSKTVPAPTNPAVTPNSTANAALADKKRERGNASAAAKILQRDLGLGGHPGGRGGRRGLLGNVVNRPTPGNASPAAKAPGTTQTTQPAISTTGNSAATSTDAIDVSVAPVPDAVPPPARNLPPSGPAASRGPTKASASMRATPSGTGPAFSKPTAPPSTATQAFLKHANPSQGITEPLLDEAFAVFGAINKVEIDKKKGFAYVDFVEPESLQKAVKASPIKVAQGQVVVLERKTGPTLQARNVRGGGPMLGNRGGGIPVGNRGGGMPVGNRGGSMRGRGGFGRGGNNFPNANNAKGTNATATTATTASTPASNASTTSAAQPATESASSHPAAQSSDASTTS
ncbi:hypothetical protein HO133_006996 [Letharia lupina]|uniref:RRM domain-containing protein n=1 Tax=Letharia lupina TaxID=560253 RepID=A0A8H6CSP4_9LECA|nr:uncharacterized protein HO133_006996 [Letharia lupina]KAF6228884.1 hypothetical protein HO133_006996 [Letharia lupina]